MDQYQEQVSSHNRGAMIVSAGPGTGKTQCLVSCFANLVRQGLAAPTDILAITFTREAAKTMRDRVQREIGQDVNSLRISTIHSLAYDLLRLLDRRKRIKVIPPEEAYEYFRRACLEAGLPDGVWDAQALFHTIARLKERLIGPDRYPVTAGSVFQETVRCIYRRYQDLLAEKGGMDFGDLVMRAVETLSRNQELASYLQSLVAFVMLDEFQDTSWAQYELARLLAGKGNILAVGSPAQAIHGWRGVWVGELLEAFHRDFPETSSITLRVNYRSVANIVRAAERVGEGYPDAVQEPHKPQGAAIQVHRPLDQYEEAALAARLVLRWMEEGIPPSEIGVLYRLHRQAFSLESQFSARGIPYIMTSGNKLYGRPEIQDVLSYLELALEPDREGPLERVINIPPRGLGPNTTARIREMGPLTMATLRVAIQNNSLPDRVATAISKLIDQVDHLHKEAKTGLPPAQMIDLIVGITGYQDWAYDLLDGYKVEQAIAQMSHDAGMFDNLPDFLKYAQEKTGGENNNGVHLSTIHAAKGQEWTAVIVSGVVESIIPHTTAETRGDVEEERRLLYVALTRARERLALLAPQTLVGERGTRSDTEPSRFLRLIPDEFLEVHG